MEDENNIMKHLGQVPELVESTKRVIEDNDKKFSILAKIAEKRAEAVIPDEEYRRLRLEMVNTVKNTQCAAPDVSEVNRLVAGRILADINHSAKEVISDAVKNAIAEHPLEIVHRHLYTTIGEIYTMADKTVRRFIIGFGAYFLFLSIVVWAIFYLSSNSEEVLGKEYVEICMSKYITDEEAKLCAENTYQVSRLPNEYKKNPDAVKAKIKRNSRIIRQRKAEARRNKGKYTLREAIEP